MKAVQIESWHVLIFFFTLVIGVFKTEITDFLYAILFLRNELDEKGKHIQILSPGGAWEDATVVAIVTPILLLREGACQEPSSVPSSLKIFV